MRHKTTFIHSLDKYVILLLRQKNAGLIPCSASIDENCCHRNQSSLTAVHCFDDGYVGKAASGLERILCDVLVKITTGKH